MSIASYKRYKKSPQNNLFILETKQQMPMKFAETSKSCTFTQADIFDNVNAMYPHVSLLGVLQKVLHDLLQCSQVTLIHKHMSGFTWSFPRCMEGNQAFQIDATSNAAQCESFIL